MALAGQQARINRVARSLKRLGFRLSTTGQSFAVVDSAETLASRSTPVMTLAEIERWIGEHIKPPGRS